MGILTNMDIKSSGRWWSTHEFHGKMEVQKPKNQLWASRRKITTKAIQVLAATILVRKVRMPSFWSLLVLSRRVSNPASSDQSILISRDYAAKNSSFVRQVENSSINESAKKLLCGQVPMEKNNGISPADGSATLGLVTRGIAPSRMGSYYYKGPQIPIPHPCLPMPKSGWSPLAPWDRVTSWQGALDDKHWIHGHRINETSHVKLHHWRETKILTMLGIS